MNIAYVTNFFPPTQTGTAHYTADLAQAVAKLGHKVTVVCPSVEPLYRPHISETMLGDVRVISIPSFKLPRIGLLMGFDNFRITAGSLLSIAHLLQADIIHQCGHLLDLTGDAPWLARKLKIPCVCSIHTAIGHPTPWIDRLMRVADKALNESVLRKYDRIIALDREVARYVSKRYGIISTALLYGVNPTGFQKWDDRRTRFQITSVGHVTKMRSREDLLQACDELIDEGLDIRVSVIGKVCYRSKKQYKHANHFRFEGEWLNTGIKHFWETSDLEAHWLTTPGLGTAILEAMACGVPCLTNGYDNILPGVPLSDGNNIIFAKPGDIAGIKQTIRTMYDSKAFRESVGMAGRKLVNDCLTWGKVAPLYVKLYEEVIQRRRMLRVI